jgi:type I restriction enzyme S subunit
VKEKNDLPNGWKYLILKKLITQDIKNGYSPTCPEEPNGRWILSLGNLTENGFDPSQVKPAPKDDMRVQDFLLAPGDFLISRSNTLDKVGRTMLFRGEIENCSYPDLLMRFRVDETQVTNEYLEGYLRSSIVRIYIQRCASGTSGSMVKINKTAVEQIPVVLPPPSEQKAIADLLSTWDEAIEKTERLIQVKEKRFKSLLRELISEPRNTQKGARWEIVKLGDVCNVTKGTQLNVEHLKDGGEYYALNGGIEPSGRTDDWNTEAETITISEGGNSCGYVNYNTERFWSGGHCYSLLNIKKNVDKRYLYFYLKMYQHIIMKLRVGSGLPNIQKKDVDKFVIVLPFLTEQQMIAETLSSAQHEIDLLKQLAERYKTLKRGLMQKMLTGEWRVKTEVVKSYE